MDFQLNDEQLHLKKTVREFATHEITPNVMKWDEASEFPAGHDQGTRQAGPDGRDLSRRIRRLRHGLCGVRYGHRGAVARGWIGRHYRGRAHVAMHEPYLSCRQRSAEKKICLQARDRRVHRRLGFDRTLVGIGCGQRPHDRNQSQGRMGPERHQDLHHQRPLRRCRRGPRGDRPNRAHAWFVGLHRRERYEGLSRRQERKQAGPARQRHVGTDL